MLGWRADVPTYSKVRFAEVYPGVDLVYYGNQRQLEMKLARQMSDDMTVEASAGGCTVRLGLNA